MPRRAAASVRLSTLPDPAVARSGSAARTVDEIGDPQGGECALGLTASCRAAGTKASLVEDVGDFGVNVVFEESVHQLDDLGLRLNLLRR